MKICVLGCGSWGIALTCHLHRSGHEPALWGRRTEQLALRREDPLRLPGAVLDPKIRVTSDLKSALQGREGVIFAAPSHAAREISQEASPLWPGSAWALSAAKGLEEGTDLRVSEVLNQNLSPDVPIAVLSGPSHAEEVFRRMPTTVVAASKDPSLALTVQKLFHSDHFRVYSSQDIIGVELGGALKNVIAIAAGITDGLGLGDNAKAALMTRGLHEITRLGTALGAHPQTFAGLAGMGDLIVTCTSRHSRNRLLGEKIGKGLSLEGALSEMVMVAEGVKTSKAALALARKAGVEVPISQEVQQVLYEGKSAKEAVAALLSRTAKPENDFHERSSF